MNNLSFRKLLFLGILIGLLTQNSLGDEAKKEKKYSQIIVNGEEKNIGGEGENIIVTPNKDEYFGVSVENDGKLTINGDSFSIEKNTIQEDGFSGIKTDSNGKNQIDINTINDININVKTNSQTSVAGIRGGKGSDINLNSSDGNIIININKEIPKGYSSSEDDYGVYTEGGNVTLKGKIIDIDVHKTFYAQSGTEADKISINGLYSKNGGNINIKGENLDIDLSSKFIKNKNGNTGFSDVRGIALRKGRADIDLSGNLNITSSTEGRGVTNYGIYSENVLGSEDLSSTINSDSLYIELITNEIENLEENQRSSEALGAYGIFVNNMEDGYDDMEEFISSNLDEEVAGEKFNKLDVTTKNNNYIKISTNVVSDNPDNAIDNFTGIEAHGKNAEINLKSLQGSNVIEIGANGGGIGVRTKDGAIINLIAENGGNIITGANKAVEGSGGTINISGNENVFSNVNYGIQAVSGEKYDVFNIVAKKGNNIVEAKKSGIELTNAEANISAENGFNMVSVLNEAYIDSNNWQIRPTALWLMNKSEAEINGKGNIFSGYRGIVVEKDWIEEESGSKLSLIATEYDNVVQSKSNSITLDNSKVDILAKNGNNIIMTGNELLKESESYWDDELGDFVVVDKIISPTVVEIKNSIGTVKGQGNYLSGYRGINLMGGSNLILEAFREGNVISSKATTVQGDSSTINITAENGVNSITSENVNGNDRALLAQNNSTINIEGKVNFISVGSKNEGEHRDGIAIKSETDSKININSSEETQVKGSVVAKGKESTINFGKFDEEGVLQGGGSNFITSSAHVKGEKVEVSEGEFKKKHIVSALYVKENGEINLNAKEGSINYISTQVDSEHNNDDRERVVWAEDGIINLIGTTVIDASNGSIEKPNSVGIAISAGGTGYEEIPEESSDSFGEIKDDKGIVNANLYGGSFIHGDIVAGRDGEINLTLEKNILDENGKKQGMTISGNILAGNGGVVNADIGENSIFTGRIDDYKDAENSEEHGENFFAPEFSNEITSRGEVNLSMGDGSRWNVTGQSWVTSIKSAGVTLIDMVGANIDKNEKAHAMTIEKLEGDTNFKVSLDGNRHESDMIYIKNAQGNINVILDEAVTMEDIGETGLRFATIGKGSNVSFDHVAVYDGGAFNIEYTVDSDLYDGHDENSDYNNSTGHDDGSLSTQKPGDSAVDDFFKDENTPVALNLAEDDKENIDETTNFKIVGVSERKISTIGETIINMSRANYSNAVYMDRFNKRLGETSYIEGNDGLWVRLRNDNIDKKDAFESNNTMYELGYDKVRYNDKGEEHHLGIAFDFMDGETEYSKFDGKGEIERKGIWLYDTWLGKNNNYLDTIIKWGHLDNSFDITTMMTNQQVSGDYNNDVFSISSEYGIKKISDKKWFVEPQIQLQYSYVTDADYTTSQNTKVKLDSIDSLIGRVGLRLGKEVDNSIFYIKGDVLYEFLGKQGIYVNDTTTDNSMYDVSYDNDGAWYDLGIGINTKLSESLNVYFDLEKSFGNDNDNTYQVNAGFRYRFK